MEDELQEIRVITRRDSAGLIIPTTIFINEGMGDIAMYEVDRILRRDNEKIDGERTTIYTCLLELNGKKKTCDIRYYPESNDWVLKRML